MNDNTALLVLNWSKDDPENKIGIFRAGRFTNVNSGLTSLCAGILSAVFFMIFFLALKPLSTKYLAMSVVVDPVVRTQNLIVVIPIVYLFFCCISSLYIKSRKIRYQQKALELAAVPQQVDFFLYEATAQPVLQRIYQMVDSPKHFILLNRIDRALANLRNVGGVSDVSSILSSQSENDENMANSSYGRIQGFVWGIPVLGFIGTVIGLSKAIGKFSQTIEVSGDINRIKSSLMDVTSGLSTAFETTLIALVAALIIQLFLSRIQAKENKFLDDCNDYCHAQVISKLRLVSYSNQPDTYQNQPNHPPS